MSVVAKRSPISAIADLLLKYQAQADPRICGLLVSNEPPRAYYCCMKLLSIMLSSQNIVLLLSEYITVVQRADHQLWRYIVLHILYQTFAPGSLWRLPSPDLLMNLPSQILNSPLEGRYMVGKVFAIFVYFSLHFESDIIYRDILVITTEHK